MNKTINIKIVDEISDDSYDDAFLERKDSCNYDLIFTERAAHAPAVILHEVWHLFFDIMSTYDDGTINYNELKKDVYAYSFEALYKKVVNELQ